MRSWALLPVLAVLAALGACSAGTDPGPAATPSGPSAAAPVSPTPKGTDATGPEATGTAPAASPADWRVEVLADGLDHPWGLRVLGGGDVLFTERSGGISVLHDGTVHEVAAGPDDLFAQGEAGLMGLELAPTFPEDGRFYTCLATTGGDVEVIAWRLAADRRTATREPAPLVTGLTLNPSGRHSGCRLRLGADDLLYIGAGDSAVGTNPQDLHALGGKVLRVDPRTGSAPADNPFADASGPAQRLIWTYGHRNVQGLAVQPGTGDLWSAEHGPDVDDEINRLEPGANYGWDPRGSGGYDESVPMTDTEAFPDSVEAVWSSGDSTLAISGIDFLRGDRWGDREGWLAVAALKDSTLSLLDVDTGRFEDVPPLDGRYGRLRTVELGPDGLLYLTTDNGADDQILRVRP